MNEANFSDFNYIWDEWITKLIPQIERQMDSKFREKVQVKQRNLDDLKKRAAEYFVDKREAIKKEYYGEAAYDSTQLMDFHKLSAVLCRTLIEYKIFDFDICACKSYIKENSIDSKDTDWLVHNALVNFRIAFYASVVFLYKSMLFRLGRIGSEMYPLLMEKKKLNLYTREDKGKVHESFENSLVLDLAKRDVNNHSFDSFLYSTIMYQLEEYNLMLLSN